ncbi:flagellar filament capping protein FliD [Dethiothermospora halolimnae]|uniref:flagellar filament capping protein FliD n=1 Tax=Dethiothermospora halolimnae TaxID=3114390 RepID=UPI003CCBB8DD
MNNMLRITGMVSGMDTETMIKQLMKAENMKVDKVKQQRQLVMWQQEEYRNISNLLRGLKDEYFDVLKPDTNFRSPAMFSAFESDAKVNGVETSIVSVEANSGATAGSHTLSDITLAKKDIWESAATVSGGLEGNTITDFSNLKKGKSFDISIDGARKTITLDKDYASATGLRDGLNTIIKEKFGIDNVVSLNTSGDGLNFDSTGNKIEIFNSKHTYVSDLGFSNGQTNAITGNELDFTSPITAIGRINIDINGTTEVVNVNINNANNIGEFVSQLQTSIDSSPIGAGSITVSNDGDKLKFISNNTSDEITFKSSDVDNVLPALGISDSSKINKLEGGVNLSLDETGKEFVISVNGSDNLIDLTKDYSSVDNLITDINNELSASGVTAANDGSGNIIFNTGGNNVKVSNSQTSIVDDLGFTSGDKSTFDVGQEIGTSGSFTINGKNFSYNSTDTYSSVISQVNSADIGVSLSYNSVKDKFVLQSKDEGYANRIDYSGTLLENTFKLDKTTDSNGDGIADSNITQGSDAKFILDGVNTTRSTNEFEVDGVNYTLNSDYTGTDDIKININSNPEELVDKIKNFVEKYNEIIDDISNKTSEKRYYDYKPLTKEQKEAMTEEDVELWEEKAKSGILRSDSILEGITRDMRTALYSGVEDVGIRLFDIGIKTSSSWREKGKLVIDEEKLTEAIKSNPNEITELFTKSEDSSGNELGDNEKGLGLKLYDIIQNNIRTTRNENGKKGLLIEKAGIENDITDIKNTLTGRIDDYDDRIDELLDELNDTETYYYNKFAKMEQALQRMQSQSSWLMGQMGGM